MCGKINGSISNSIGAPSSIQRTSTGITGSTKTEKFALKFYNDSIVRITISRADLEDFSYAVIAEPQALSLDFHEDDQHLVVKSEKLSARITKNPLRVAFYNHKN